MALPTTTLLPPGLYPAGTYSLGPAALPVGVSAASLRVDRTTWNDPSLQITASLEFSPDGGTTWFSWGSVGTTGEAGVGTETTLDVSFIHRIAGDGYGLMNPYTTGVPYVQAPGTIEPGFEPTNVNRVVRGTVIVSAAVTTMVLMTLDDAIVPLTLPAVSPHASVSIADITFGITGATNGATVTTPAFTVTSNVNRAGLLGLTTNTNSISAITGSLGGTSGSAIAGTDSGTAQTVRTLQFGVTAPPAGSQTATMSWTTLASVEFGAITTSGVDQTTPFNNGTFTSGTTNGTASVTITSTNGDLTMDTVGDNSGTIGDPSAPTQTQIWQRRNATMCGGGSNGPGTGTTTHQWTLDVNALAWAQSGVNLVQSTPPADTTAAPFRPGRGGPPSGILRRRALPQQYPVVLLQPNQLAVDDFNRGDSSTLGPNWTAMTGTAGITNEQAGPLTFDVNGFSLQRYSAIAWPDDQYSELKVIDNASATGCAGPAVRCSSIAVTAYAINCNNDVGDLRKIVAGVGTLLGTFPAPAVNDIVRLEVQGTTLRVYVNGVFVLTVSDSAISSGSAGINCGAATARRWDNWAGGVPTVEWTATPAAPFKLPGRFGPARRRLAQRYPDAAPEVVVPRTPRDLLVVVAQAGQRLNPSFTTRLHTRAVVRKPKGHPTRNPPIYRIVVKLAQRLPLRRTIALVRKPGRGIVVPLPSHVKEIMVVLAKIAARRKTQALVRKPKGAVTRIRPIRVRLAKPVKVPVVHSLVRKPKGAVRRPKAIRVVLSKPVRRVVGKAQVRKPSRQVVVVTLRRVRPIQIISVRGRGANRIYKVLIHTKTGGAVVVSVRQQTLTLLGVGT